MADVNDIIQRIVIQAEDQATAVIARVAVEAKAAFGGLSDGVDKAASAVKNFTGSFAEGFGQNFKQAFADAAPAAAATATAVAGIGEKAAITKGEIREIGTVMRELDLGPLAGIATTLGKVTLSFGAFAAGAVAIGAFSAAMFKAAEAAAETEKALSGLSAVSGISFENLSSLQLAFAEGGTSAKKFAQEMTKLFEGVDEGAPQMALKVAESTANVVKAQQAVTDAAKNQNVSLAEYRVLQQKLLAAQANDLGPLIAKYQQLASGIKQNFDPLTTLESKATAIKAVLAGLGYSADILGQNLTKTGETGQKAFYALADIFHNLGTEAEKLELGKKLGLDPETIATLSKGSDALKAMQQHLVDLGIVLNSTDKSALQGFRDEVDKLSTVWTGLTQKMGALASPALTSFIEGLREGLEELSPKLIQLATQFGQLDLKDFGRGLIKTLGDIADGVMYLIGLWKQLTGATAVTIPGVSTLKQLYSALQDAVFYFNLLSSAAQLAGASIRLGLLQAFGGSQEAIDATKKRIDDITKSWDAYKEAAKAAGVEAAGAIKPAADATKQAGDEATKTGTETQQAFQQSTKSVDQQALQVDGLISKYTQLAQAASAAGRAMASAASGGGSGDLGGLPMATGGLFHGQRSGIDTNLAWLTSGEFVMSTQAVRRYGVGVMNAINSLQAPRFAAGGLNMLTPRQSPVASPSLSGQRVLHLSIEGRSFTGLSIPEQTAQSLERFAVHSQIASTGRKQSWRR